MATAGIRPIADLAEHRGSSPSVEAISLPQYDFDWPCFATRPSSIDIAASTVARTFAGFAKAAKVAGLGSGIAPNSLRSSSPF